MLGKREAGRFVSGKLIDRGLRKKLASELPVMRNWAQWICSWDAFSENRGFDNLKNEIIEDGDYDKLLSNDSFAISSFIKEQFKEAQMHG